MAHWTLLTKGEIGLSQFLDDLKAELVDLQNCYHYNGLNDILDKVDDHVSVTQKLFDYVVVLSRVVEELVLPKGASLDDLLLKSGDAEVDAEDIPEQPEPEKLTADYD